MTREDPLLAVFESKNALGEKNFSPKDISHYLPLLLLRAGVGMDGLEPHVVDAIGRVSIAAGITEEMDSAAATKAIDLYYEENPPLPALVIAISGALKTIEAEGDTISKSAANFLGQKVSNRPVGATQAPEAGFKGGLLAQLNAQKSLKSDD